MKRVSGDGGDVFKPQGQLRREIELAGSRPQQVIAILQEHLSEERRIRIAEVVAHRIRRLCVAIEGVIDPHNTAAVIRTAEAFGIQTVHAIERSHRFLSSRKVTQGTHKWVDLAVWKHLEDFHRVVKSEGKRILIAEAEAKTTLQDLDSALPTALVFGNEHAGVSPEMRDLADGTFSIPMFGFATSVNVSVAAGITISTLCRKGNGDLSNEEKGILTARYYLRAVRAGYDIVMQEL